MIFIQVFQGTSKKNTSPYNFSTMVVFVSATKQLQLTEFRLNFNFNWLMFLNIHLLESVSLSSSLILNRMQQSGFECKFPFPFSIGELIWAGWFCSWLITAEDRALLHPIYGLWIGPMSFHHWRGCPAWQKLEISQRKSSQNKFRKVLRKSMEILSAILDNLRVTKTLAHANWACDNSPISPRVRFGLRSS